MKVDKKQLDSEIRGDGRSGFDAAPKGDIKAQSEGGLQLLETYLKIPCLKLLKTYLEAANGCKKTAENCVSDFSSKHKITFAICFIIDFILRFIIIACAIYMALRGLGIVDCLRCYMNR